MTGWAMYRNRKSNQPQYAVELVWAAVSAADRVNGGEYVKSGTVVADRPELKSNRELAMQFIASPETITDEDRKFGEEIAGHFRGTLFGMLGKGVMNDFMTTVGKITTMTEVGNYEIAVMSSLPSVYRRSVVREQRQEELTQSTTNSNFIGSVGTRLNTLVRVYERFFSERYQSFIVTAVSDGNVIKFFTSKDAFTPQAEFKIKGTVKSHSVNNRNGVKETWLNRVQVI